MTYFALLIVLIEIFAFKGIFCLSLQDELESVVIVIEDDPVDRIVLNCNYILDNNESVRTLKWYKENVAMYQWLPGINHTRMPEFKNLVDDSYVGSTIPEKEFSSLALINPTINSTGNYKCVVQTQSKTYYSHKRLQIIDIRNFTFSFDHRRVQNETQLECTVARVFPKPTISVISNDGEAAKIISEKISTDSYGYINFTTIAAAYENIEDPDYYKCVMEFDGYAFNLTRTATSASGIQLEFQYSLIAYLFFFYCYYYI